MADFEKTIPERFRAKYDSDGDYWAVLDTWHPQVKNIADLEQDIPLDSPAIKKIANSEMNAVIGEMIKMGWMEKFGQRINAEVIEKPIKNIPEDIRKIAIENITLIIQNEADSSVAKEAILAIREIIKEANK